MKNKIIDKKDNYNIYTFHVILGEKVVD